MDVGSRAARKSLKEICHQFGLQVAHQPRAHLGIDSEGSASAQIDGCNCKSLVHRHQEVSGAQNAALVAKGAIEGLAQRDAHVLDGMVLVNVEVSIAFEFQVECAVAGEELQHVIEEANAGGDLVLAAAFDGEMDGDTRLGGIALDDGGA